MPILRGDDEGRRPVRPPRARVRPQGEQEGQALRVAVLGREENRGDHLAIASAEVAPQVRQQIHALDREVGRRGEATRKYGVFKRGGEMISYSGQTSGTAHWPWAFQSTCWWVMVR